MTEASDLNLLLVHADDHDPVLADPLPAAAAPTQKAEEDDDGAHPFWDEGRDPNDLPLQRWGVLAPDGSAGDRLLAIIRPLIERREAEQGAPAVIHRVPAGMTAEDAIRWKKGVFDASADLALDVPRYQLILGDLDQVSLDLQQVQQSDGYVGRLAFPRDDDYAAYVDKLLRLERRPPGARRPDALFYTVHDGTGATNVGHRALVGPGVELVRARHQQGKFPAHEVIEFGDWSRPSPDELLTHTARTAPAVLFSVSHGEGAPKDGWSSPDEQRRRQGAMSFGREGKLTGDDLRGRAFLPGGAWFMLACYGAGTPNLSAYRHWLAQLAGAGQFRGRPEAVLAGLPGPGDRPFVAAVPQAVLADPRGPVAFIGHVDLAWTYGFQELDEGVVNRTARFMAISRALVRRDRVGVAMRELQRFASLANLELTTLHDRLARDPDGAPTPARMAHLWMLRQDLAAYALLGDPAARVAESDEPATVATSSVPDVGVAPPPRASEPAGIAPAAPELAAPPVAAAPQGSTATPATPATPCLKAEPDTLALEAAIVQVVAAVLEIEAAAARVGLPRHELEQLAARYRQAGHSAITCFESKT